MKKCTKCNREKETLEFHKSKQSPDGLYNWCKTCKQEYDQKYRKTEKTQSLYKSKEYRDRKKEYSKYIRETSPELILYRNTKSRAKRFNIPFNLTLSDLTIPETCPILNIPLYSNRGSGNPKPSKNSPSVDKIIPELGYVKGNVWVISYKANIMKNNATIDELKLFCTNVLNKLNKLNEINGNLNNSNIDLLV